MLPSGTVIVTATKPGWRCLTTFVCTQRSKPSPGATPFGAMPGVGPSVAICMSAGMSSGSQPHGWSSSSCTCRLNSSMPTLCRRNFTRALFMFLRRRFEKPPSLSNTLRQASATRMYSPLSASAKSQTTSARRGIVERPPPTTTSKPRTSLPFTFLILAMKPMSWNGVPAQSMGPQEKAVFHLRGRFWQIGLRSMLRA